MQRNRRTLAAALPVLAGLGLVATAATSPFLENERAIELKAGRAWADANRDHLPTTLEAISAFPITHRKAVLSHPNVSIAQRELCGASTSSHSSCRSSLDADTAKGA